MTLERVEQDDRALVEEHGGAIRVQSSREAGTTLLTVALLTLTTDG